MAYLTMARFGVDVGLFILIWLVQIIIYPSFRYVDVAQFDGWHSRYMGLITYFVGPLMLLQVAIIGMQLLHDFDWKYVVAAILVGGVWVSTAALSIPCHTFLQQNGYDLAMINKLVSTNWYRTIAWTAVLSLSTWEVWRSLP